MTGFAHTTTNVTTADGYHSTITISLKTLNSRYFELSCKLPPLVSHLETKIMKILKETVHRGNVFLTISMTNQSMLQAHVEPAIPLAKSYVKAIETLKKECCIEGNVTMADMLRLAHNLFVIEQKECDSSLENAVIDALETAVAALVSARTEEGMVLLQDIQQRHNNILHAMTAVTKGAQTFLEQKKKEIAQKIAALEGEPAEFVQMRKNAFHIELDKIDIHEEIVRFNAHLANLNTLLTSDEQEKGRHINFILQELGREINTLSAKCSDVSIGNLAITIKVELEKIREQTQNIL